MSFARNGSQFDSTDAWYLRVGWSSWPILIDGKNRPCVFLGAVGLLLSQSTTYDNLNPLLSPPFPLLNVTFDTTLSSLSSLKCVRHFELKCMYDSFQLQIAVIAFLSGFDTSTRLVDHFPFYWSEGHKQKKLCPQAQNNSHSIAVAFFSSLSLFFFSSFILCSFERRKSRVLNAFAVFMKQRLTVLVLLIQVRFKRK